jgi:SOS-response transcriptional repressor LexA
MNAWYEHAKREMEARGISQEQMAEWLGVTQGAVGHWLNGKREPKLETINHLLGLLSLPQLSMAGFGATALEAGPPLSRPFQRTKIVGTAQLGPDGYWDALAAADGWLDVPTTDPDAYSLRVKGESMAPAIRSGWVVWCEPNHQLIPGEYVMVRCTDGQSMVKELLYENAEEVSLMAVNDGYGRLTIARSDIEQIHYVGGIVPPSKIKY